MQQLLQPEGAQQTKTVRIGCVTVQVQRGDMWKLLGFYGYGLEDTMACIGFNGFP